MNEEQKLRLLIETQEMANRLNKLNAFMATDTFIDLPREDKDLLYSQQRIMSKYLQVLGKRLERVSLKFRHATQLTSQTKKESTAAAIIVKTEWIDIKTEQPKIGQKVLLLFCVGENIEGGEYLGNGDFNCNWCKCCGTNYTYKISHWMPRPDLPIRSPEELQALRQRTSTVL